MEAIKELEYDLSDVEVFCVGEVDVTEYIRKKVIESMKKEENSLNLNFN